MNTTINRITPIETTRDDVKINWGAVFASLVFIYALSWLLFTLSSAVGLSIVEVPNPHDTNIKPESLTLSVALLGWVITTIVITYLLGGWLAGRLSGVNDTLAVTLHGLVVWSLTILIAAVLGVLGVNSLLSTAGSAVKTTASVSANVGGKAINSGGNAALSQLDGSLQPLVASIKKEIKKANSERSENSSTKENNSTGSTDTSSTANNESKEDENDSSDNEDSASTTTETSSKSDGNKDEDKTSNKENKRHGHKHHHGNRIESQVLNSITVALVQGDVNQAKEIIISNTELDEKQVDEIINSVKDKAEKFGNEFEKKANEARKYASALIWLVFFSYLIALISSIIGARFAIRNWSSPVLSQTK